MQTASASLTSSGTGRAQLVVDLEGQFDGEVNCMVFASFYRPLTAQQRNSLNQHLKLFSTTLDVEVDEPDE